MFGIGGPELAVILVLGLILVGPKKLPQVARTVGAGLRDLKRAANMAQTEFRETVDELIREADLDDTLTQLRRDIEVDPKNTEETPNRLTSWQERAEMDAAPRSQHPDEGWHFDDDDDDEIADDDDDDDESDEVEQGLDDASDGEPVGVKPEPTPERPRPTPVEGAVSWRPPDDDAGEP